MDLSLRPQMPWGKEFPPDLNIDNHPDLPPSKGPANFFGDRRKRNHNQNNNRNHNQNKRLESAEKAWLHTLPWSYADVVINKQRRFKENNQGNVEFKNSCFSNMIWRATNESNDNANNEKTNSESMDGDSFLNPNANEFVPEIQSNGNEDTSCQLFEAKEISQTEKNIGNDDDIILQEQLIKSESNASYNDEALSVVTRSDETMMRDDNESASQTNSIYEAPDLDKQNTEINPSDVCKEENNVTEVEGENDTASDNQFSGAEPINDCDVSEIKLSNYNKEQNDPSSYKSQVEEIHIENISDSESSTRNGKENEELGDERQVESEHQSQDSPAQVESEIPESDNTNEAQIESEIPQATNDGNQAESGILESNTAEKAQLEPKIEEPYDCESLAESEYSETIIANEPHADSEIQESFNDSLVQPDSEIFDSNIVCEAQVSETQESYNANQFQEESEILDSCNATQLQGGSEMLDVSIDSEAQVESDLQESYSATQMQGESEILDASITSEAPVLSEIHESYNATQLQEELGIQDSSNAGQLQEELEIQDSSNAHLLQEELEIQDSSNAGQLQEEFEIQDFTNPPQLQEELEIQELDNTSLFQAESEVQSSNVVSRTLDESEKSQLSKLSHDCSDETEVCKSSDSHAHDSTETRNSSLGLKANDVTNVDEIKSAEDHPGVEDAETPLHQDVDKENTAVAPEQTTTKKNKKRRNKKKNKVSNQSNNGLDFDELVKDKTNYAENHFDNVESSVESVSLHSSRSASLQSVETKNSPKQSFPEQETKLTSKSSEINQEPTEDLSVKDSKSMNESVQNNISDVENNEIKFKNEHFDINEVDKFIEEEQKAMAEFPNELDVVNQMKLEEELTDIVLSEKNEELNENISNEVKEEINNQNDDGLGEKESSDLNKDDTASLAGSSDQESSFEIINENAVIDDVVGINKLSQDLLNGDGDLDENEVKDKTNKGSSTDTISSNISSIPQEETNENQTYDISGPKELDINKNETVMSLGELEQNEGAYIAGVDMKTENEDITLQEDHFSNKHTEAIAEKLSCETYDSANTKNIIDDTDIVETDTNNLSNEIFKETENSVILTKDVPTTEPVNNGNKEASFIKDRFPVSSHDAVNDNQIVAFVTQIEKPDIIMNGGESASELPDQLEIHNFESNLASNEVLATKIPDIVITREIKDEPVTKVNTAESFMVDELVKSKTCSGSETSPINKVSKPSDLTDEVKNEGTFGNNERSRTEEKSYLAPSDTELETKQTEDFTISDELNDGRMLKEMINKLPNRVMPITITENDVESAGIQELSTIAEITERTVSELPEDNSGRIVHVESDVEKSEKNIETIKSQLEEGITNDSEKCLGTETETSISSHRDDEGEFIETPTEAGQEHPVKNKMTVSAFIKPKAIDIKTSSKSAPKATPRTSSKPTTSKPATGIKLAPTSTAKLAITSTTKTAKPTAATAKLATSDLAKPAASAVKLSATGSAKPVAAASKPAALGSPKPTKPTVGAAIKFGSKAASPAKPTVTTIKIAIKAAPKVASTKPTTGKTVAAVKPATPPLKVSLTTKPSTPPSKPLTPKSAKISSRPSTATKPLTPTTKANLAAAISLPAKPDSSTTSAASTTSTTATTTTTTMKKPSTPSSKSMEKSSSKTSTVFSKPSSATRPTSASSKTPQTIKKQSSPSSKPPASKAANETMPKTVVKNTTEPTKTITKNALEQSKSTLKTISTSSVTKPSTTQASTTEKTKTTSSSKTSSKSAPTVKKLTSVKDKKAKSPTKSDDKNVEKSIKTSSNKLLQSSEMTLNEVSSTTDYMSTDTGLSLLSELPPQIIV